MQCFRNNRNFSSKISVKTKISCKIGNTNENATVIPHNPLLYRYHNINSVTFHVIPIHSISFLTVQHYSLVTRSIPCHSTLFIANKRYPLLFNIIHWQQEVSLAIQHYSLLTRGIPCYSTLFIANKKYPLLFNITHC